LSKNTIKNNYIIDLSFDEKEDVEVSENLVEFSEIIVYN
jgi:hypothetical protein